MRNPWLVARWSAYLLAILGAFATSVFVPRVSVLGIWLATAAIIGTVVALLPQQDPQNGRRVVTLLQIYAV